MNMYLWIALGGAIGAAGRHFVFSQAMRLSSSGFPWATLCVNVMGSLVMGLLIGGAAQKLELSNEMRAFLATGVLGGFTTFSAFSLDVSVLLERKAQVAAGAYVAGSVGLSIFALFVGLWSARSLFQ